MSARLIRRFFASHGAYNWATLRVAEEEEVEQSPALVPLLIGVIIGGTVASAIAWRMLGNLRTKLGVSEARAQAQLGQSERLSNELTDVKGKLERSVAEQGRLNAEVARLNATLEAETSRNAEKIALLREAKEKFSDEFESLANRILEEKSKRFTEQNQENLGQ